MKKFLTYQSLFLICTSALSYGSLVRPLPLLPGDKPSPDYELLVDGQPVPVAFGSFHGNKRFHHAGFELDGEVTVTVRFSADRPNAVEVVPSRHAITLLERGNSVSFKLDQAHKLVLKAEGLRPLFLFALPPEADPPDPDDPKVHYFAPGIHEVGLFRPQSGETVYLAPGAVVKGILHAFELEDLVVRGRGLWDARGYTSKPKKIHGMLFERSKNIRIEGIQLRTGEWWQTNFLLSSDIEIEHMMLMSFGLNNDGIDVDGVTNLSVRHCFIGCGDDGFGWHALDAVRFGEPPSRNLLAEHCVIWNEHAGNGLRVGASMETSVFENITFRDIDVLQVQKRGYAIMMDHSDWAHTRNVLFERFYNESGRPLMSLSTKKTRYSNKTGYRDERGIISDIYFHDVTSTRPGVTLLGADAEHGIRDLWFVNCSLGGKPLTSASGFRMNEHVSDLHFVDRMPERRVRPVELPKGRQPAELTIDDGEPGFWAFGGDDLETIDDIPEATGGSIRRLKRLGAGHAAVYKPELEGRYEVQIHWVAQPKLSGKTPWTVHHVDGYDTTAFAADTETGWHSLGTYDLDAASWVRLVDPHYAISDGPVVADAVRFILQESEVREQKPGIGIYLNQSGFNTGEVKRFTAPTLPDDTPFVIKPADGGDPVYEGVIGEQLGDFSDFEPKDARAYEVHSGGHVSVPFKVGLWHFERITYQPSIDFMVDSRHYVGNYRKRCRGSFAWRDDHHFAWVLRSIVPQYLSNPAAYERMTKQIHYEAPREKLWGALKPYDESAPDIVKLIHWGADVTVTQGTIHEMLKGELAYFLYAWPWLKQWLPQQNYDAVLSFAQKTWALEEADRKYPYDETKNHNLFALKTTIGSTKGGNPPGHSLMPNLLMYHVMERDGHDGAKRYFDAAYAQAEWMIKELDWEDPQVTKGQRLSEHLTMTGLATFLEMYPERAPKGLREKINEWAAIMVRRSENMWDFRKLTNGGQWTPSGSEATHWNEVGNVVGFPAALLAAKPFIDDPATKERFRELVWSHIDNSFGRNPCGRHFSHDAPREIEGVEHGWYSFYKGGIGQLAEVRFVLDGAPKHVHYPYHPEKGNYGWTEGWVSFNSAFNHSLAYMAKADTEIQLKQDGADLQVALKAPLNFDPQESEPVEVSIEGKKTIQLELVEAGPDSPFHVGRVALAELGVRPGDLLRCSYGYGYMQTGTELQVEVIPTNRSHRPQPQTCAYGRRQTFPAFD